MTTLTTPEQHSPNRTRVAITLVSALAVVAIGVSTAVALPRMTTTQPTVTAHVTGKQFRPGAGYLPGGSVYDQQVPYAARHATPSVGNQASGRLAHAPGAGVNQHLPASQPLRPL